MPLPLPKQASNEAKEMVNSEKINALYLLKHSRKKNYYNQNLYLFNALEILFCILAI